MLKMVNGKWAIVSKTKGKPLAYYDGEGKPDEEWIKKQEKRIQYFKNKKEDRMKTYKDFVARKNINEVFNFKSAVKNGFLDKSDEKYVKELKKKGWDIDEFNITSKGFEITVINKKKVKKTFSDKRPELVLKTAATKSKK